MSTTHAYSQVLMALLAMILLLMVPLMYGPQSFHFKVGVKVFLWGMVLLMCLVYLAQWVMP